MKTKRHVEGSIEVLQTKEGSYIVKCLETSSVRTIKKGDSLDNPIEYSCINYEVLNCSDVYVKKANQSLEDIPRLIPIHGISKYKEAIEIYKEYLAWERQAIWDKTIILSVSTPVKMIYQFFDYETDNTITASGKSLYEAYTKAVNLAVKDGIPFNTYFCDCSIVRVDKNTEFTIALPLKHIVIGECI